MRREEALSFLKEILSESPFMTLEAIILNQSQDSTSYTVDIKEAFSCQIVKDIARKHNLSVKEEKDRTIVFTPTA